MLPLLIVAFFAWLLSQSICSDSDLCKQLVISRPRTNCNQDTGDSVSTTENEQPDEEGIYDHMQLDDELALGRSLTEGDCRVIDTAELQLRFHQHIIATQAIAQLSACSKDGESPEQTVRKLPPSTNDYSMIHSTWTGTL